MSYKILYDNPEEDLFQRLMKIRNIDSDVDSFLNPSFSNSWIDPYKLNDFKASIERIKTAISNNEKIIIFGDYDVDGITASFLMYEFFTKSLGYKNISIRLPHRIQDGYGIRTHHIDEIANKGVNLIITVDNGITAVEEVKHAKKKGIDMIITDHHKPLENIPEATAVVNPQVSNNYEFKGIAGVGVAFKLCMALSSIYIKSQNKKEEIVNYLLPIVAIGTVADCVPLVYENRLLVKKGLNIINSSKNIPQSLKNIIKYLNINYKLNSFHIGFLIAPRINAGGRMGSPYDSLNCLINSSTKQTEHIEKLEKLNDERRQTQDDIFKEMEEQVNHENNILIAESKNIHEGVVGIVAGKITEKYQKPSVIISIKEEDNIAVASLRGPLYFSIIDMLNQAGDYMERYGGHKQAGGITVKLENLEKVKEIFIDYCNKNIKQEDISGSKFVDTPLYPWELEKGNINEIEKLEPFGEGNPQPLFVIKDIIINSVEKVGKNGKSHIKAYASKQGIKFPTLFWGKGENIDKINLNEPSSLIGKVKRDDYNGGFFIEGNEIISN